MLHLFQNNLYICNNYADFQRNNFLKMDNEEYLKRLGDKIYALRKLNGMSQKELSKRMGTQHTQIVRIEKGQVNSSILVLKKIAEELEVSIGELVNI